MTLRTVLLSLQSLLSSAEPDDPQDAVVAAQVQYLIIKYHIGWGSSNILGPHIGATRVEH